MTFLETNGKRNEEIFAFVYRVLYPSKDITLLIIVSYNFTYKWKYNEIKKKLDDDIIHVTFKFKKSPS